MRRRAPRSQPPPAGQDAANGLAGDVAALHRARLFADIPPAGLRPLAAAAQRCTFPTGAALMTPGEPSDLLHVLVDGRVRVEQALPEVSNVPVRLAELGPGDVVGEMGVLDHAPRSATVTALEDTHTLGLGPDLLAATALQYPTVTTALLRILSERLRSTNDLVARLSRRPQAWHGPW
jgi:CRP-like cAMP-binding protein